MYQEFASIYDKMMKNNDYEKWTDYIENIFSFYGASPKTVVDLACGTGGVTIPLARRGYAVTGVDISGDMLYQAREKARVAGLKIPFICQDMTSLTLHKPVDAILCMCDGFNYLPDIDRLKITMNRIKSYLNPGGILVFDISSYYKLSSILGNNIMGDNGDDISMLWINHFDTLENKLRMDLTFFVKEGRGYKRFDETHEQHAYKEEDILLVLEEAGFTKIQSFAPFTLEHVTKKSHRIFFAACLPHAAIV